MSGMETPVSAQQGGKSVEGKSSHPSEGSTSGTLDTESQAGSSGGGGAAGQSWNAAEFLKRKHAFEGKIGSAEAEELALFPEDDNSSRAKRLRELACSQIVAPLEPGLDFNRGHSSTSNREASASSLKSPPMGSYSPFSAISQSSGDSGRRQTATSNSRVPISEQTISDEDDVALGLAPPRRPPSNQRVLAIGEETGQKEPYNETASSSSPPLRSNQSEDSERDDRHLSRQIESLTVKNQELQKELEEREQERNRLREQLEIQRTEKGYRSIYSPPGLPSRVLDGRKVLRDSVPLVTSPGIPISSSSPLPPQSPLSHSPRHVASPLPTQFPQSTVPHSPRSRLPKDFETTPSTTKRRNIVPEEFILPRTDSNILNDHYLQQIEELKRDNKELERRLHELLEERRKLESELGTQKEAFDKIQAREQDLSKDIEILRDENSHNTDALKRLQDEREGLKSENETLQENLTTINEKLKKTEKCYNDVEHENLSLEAEIEQLVNDKKLLYEEKQKLQMAVEDALKTKENYRSSIKQLREQNQSLENQIRQPGSQAAKPEKKKVMVPATKEHKTLNEVMNLREEKLQLQDRLLSAKQEIDSLEVHLKVQDGKDIPVDDLRGEITQHLAHFRAQVSSVREDLDSTKSAISFFIGQPHVLAHDSFIMLVSKCREYISMAENDKSKLNEALSLAESSFAKISEDYEHLKSENAKLHSQKISVTDELSALKEEVAMLQDQKRLLSVKLSQNETILHERDGKISEMESSHKQLQERYSTSERNWKREFSKLELEWSGKVAEAEQQCELLLEDKDTLLKEKVFLEERIAEVILENEKLTVARDELIAQVEEMEKKMESINSKVDENEQTISRVQGNIASLLAKKVCLVAQMRVEEEVHKEKVASMEKERAKVLSNAHEQTHTLQERVDILTREREDMANKLEEITSKEEDIGKLESQMAVLIIKQEQLQAEKDAQTKKLSSLLQEIQALQEGEHSRRLHNEKVKMTLTTEMKLLKSKLSSLEDENDRLKSRLGDVGKEHAKQSGAFQALAASKQVDQMKQQSSDSKHQRKFNLESAGSRTIAELQSRLTLVEGENKCLKEATMKNSCTHTDLDEETVMALRKKLTEKTRMIFFLESDKQSLTGKVERLTASLKSARETHSHVTTGREQKLLAEKRALQEKIHALEGSLTKKLMAADAKILETVKENDKLKHKLIKIQSAIGSEQSQTSGLESLLTLLKSESKVLQELKSSLEASSNELEQLESGHHRIESLQQEIHLTVSSSQESESASPTESKNVPAVFKSLPAGYLSNLQGRKTPSRLDSRSASFSISNSDLQKKLSEVNSATVAFGENFQKHVSTLKQKDKEVDSIHGRLVSLEDKFRAESERSVSLHETLSAINQGMDLHNEELQVVMQKQIEKLQDQVIDRDSALSDIEAQMKVDFEMHERKFALMRSQVLELRELLSSKSDLLRSKDQYIQQTEDQCLKLENDLFKAQKELERVINEQKELVRQGLPESMQLQGISSVTDVIRIQGEKLNQLQKLLSDFTRKMSEVQSQLEATQREKSVLLSKAIEMERMHMQMKEHMGSDITYLRQLNLQLVEQQMKAEKATEILKEVKEAQTAFKKQKDVIKLEQELDASKIKLLEQNHKITELESQVATQTLMIKVLRAEKDHQIMLTHHVPELTNQITGLHLRPRSAESARKPKYKISDFKSRAGIMGRNTHGEFSIILPSQSSTHGNSGVDILNLEEQPETENTQRMLSLGPMVVTDDEYAVNQEMEKTTGKQRYMKFKKCHRRTASTGSNIIPFSKEKDSMTSGAKGVNQTVPSMTFHPKQSLGLPVTQKPHLKNPRPGSAGSTRQDGHIRQESGVRPMEEIAKTAHAFTEYMHTLIDDHTHEGMVDDDEPVKLSVKDAKETLECPPTMKDATNSGRGFVGSVSGRSGSGEGVSTGGGVGVGAGGSKSGTGKGTISRNQPANKSTDSNETSSSEGSSSKNSSQSDSGISGSRVDSKRPMENINQSNEGAVSLYHRHPKGEQITDLSRTQSMSSTCSTLSIYGSSTLPSRNPSFTYDGGESSTTYSYESLEIGDSVENLQKLGYSPYIHPIMPSGSYNTTSSSDPSDDENYRKSRKKKSSTTGDNTPRHKDIAYHSNSSCDSDTQQQSGYRDSTETGKRMKIPMHVNESISISDMDRDTTDIEMDQKVADLQQCFRRVRQSSTGSMKICYSESSNTSMEDISKN